MKNRQNYKPVSSSSTKNPNEGRAVEDGMVVGQFQTDPLRDGIQDWYYKDVEYKRADIASLLSRPRQKAQTAVGSLTCSQSPATTSGAASLLKGASRVRLKTFPIRMWL